MTLSGGGMPTTVDVDGYDSRLAADAMASAEHDGEYRIEPYEELRGGPRPGAGRPRGSRSGPRAPASEVVAVRLPVEVAAMLDERAREKGQDRNAFVQALLTRAARPW